MMLNSLKYLKLKVYDMLNRNKICINELKLSRKSNKKDEIEKNILLLVHSLEKGMGLRLSRKDFGKEKALQLLNLLKKYNEEYDDVSLSFAYCEGLCLLDSYINLRSVQGLDNSFFESWKTLYVPSYTIENSYSAGYKLFSRDELLIGKAFDLKSFFASRHSIRTFSKDEISKDEIKNVIELALMSPSACNRQPYKVYYSLDKNKTDDFEKLIAGSRGFEGEIPYFMVVTVKRNLFNNDEFLQWYINGGIFTSFLILALHNKGFGSIIMQWKQNNKNEEAMKNKLKIDYDEVIICVVGFGKYADGETKCICAQRRAPDDVLVEF